MNKFKILAISLAAALLVGLIGLVIARHNKCVVSADRYSYSVDQIQQWHEDAEHGDVGAQIRLGIAYTYGKGADINDAEAAKWYRMAAEQGDDDAQFTLSFIYLGGKGVDRDSFEALKWLRKSATQGNAASQSILGSYEAQGGVETNSGEIAMRLVEAAQQYYTKSTTELADRSRKAAEQGDAKAQSSLGFCYARGLGVGKNKIEAAKWYRKAAEQGHASAQSYLGGCYSCGEGVETNLVEAVKWYRMAAEQGHTGAQYALGYNYENGKGVETNPVEALKWYQKAAEQGHTGAQYALGSFYVRGLGVTRDVQTAYGWILLARGGGNKAASSYAEVLEKSLSPSQLQEARDWVKNWKPKPAK